MCVVVAVVFPGGGLLATDTRFTMYFLGDQEPLRVDQGGKLWECPAGLLTGTGEGALLNDVREASKAASSAEAVGEAIRRTYEARREVIEEIYPQQRLDRTTFVLVPRELPRGAPFRPIVRFLADGTRVAEDGPTNHVLSLPPELDPGEDTEMGEVFRGRCAAAQDLGAFVRAVAAVVRDAGRLSDTVSPEIDIALVHDSGLVAGFRRPAERLARTDHDEIVAAFQG